MSGPRGYLAWTEPFVFQHPWLDGAFMVRANCPQSWDPESKILLLETHAGTHVGQRWITGSKSPLDMSRRTFTLTCLVWDADDCYRLQAAQSKGLVLFSSGIRCVDVFQAVAGSTYLLRRPLAAGIVTDVTDVTHPTIFLFNNVIDSGAATVTGQSMTALKTGVIEVRYTAAHWVKVSAGWTIPQPNELNASIQLEEALVGDHA